MIEWSLTEPMMEQVIKEATDRGGCINEENVRQVLTDFYTSQRFEFSGNKISPEEDKWGTYEVVSVKNNRILIREFYESLSEYTETNPQKLLDIFSSPTQTADGDVIATWLSSVPLFTGIEFVGDNRMKIYKLDANKGKVTSNLDFEHSIMRRVGAKQEDEQPK